MPDDQPVRAGKSRIRGFDLGYPVALGLHKGVRIARGIQIKKCSDLLA